MKLKHKLMISIILWVTSVFLIASLTAFVPKIIFILTGCAAAFMTGSYISDIED